MNDSKPPDYDPFRFNTRGMLLLIAFVWIASRAWRNSQEFLDFRSQGNAECLVLLLPCWLPFLFLAYALGRRKLSAVLVVVFLIAEIVIIYALNDLGLGRLIRL